MNAKFLIASMLAANIFTTAAPSAVLFESGLDAKLVGSEIDLWFVLANHSRHPACYLVTNAGAVTVRTKDGAGATLVLPDDMHEDTNPLPVQFVPDDGQSHHLYWRRVQISGVNAKDISSVETAIVLYDCQALTGRPSKERELYRSTISAQVAQ